MRLIFWVEDDDGTIIGEKKQIPIQYSEEQLVAADKRDADRLKEANTLIGEECFASISAFGRGRYTREIFMALGTLVERTCHRLCADKLGVRRMFDLLDATKEKL